MARPEASAAFYRRLLALQLALIAAARRSWARMDADHFDESWAGLLPALLAVVAAGQLAAARLASAFVPAALAELGTPVAADALVLPAAFAGIAADGRSLPGLLLGSVVRAKEAARTKVVEFDEYVEGTDQFVTHRYTVPGKSPEQALAEGGRWLDTLVQTIVTDAARGAAQAEIAVRPDVGYVRRVNPPCCGRCALLAGRWYRYDAGFPRHPQCDCVPEPAVQADAHMLITDPDVLFETGLVHGLTKRERDRLDAGEDRVKVINESRNMWRARIQEQKRGAAETPEQVATREQTARQGLEDLFASTRNRIEAVQAMKSQGYVQ